jgi:hypothetical protein
LSPGEIIAVNVIANFTKGVSSFTLSFAVDAGISIVGISYDTTKWTATVKANSAQQWAIVANPIQPSSSTVLCTVSIQASSVANQNARYSFSSTILTLNDLKNAPVLIGGQPLPAMATFIDRNGVSTTGSIYVNSPTPTAMFAFSSQSEFINTAVLGNAVISAPISVLTVNTAGSINAASTGLACTSSNPMVIQSSSSCQFVFLNGTETSGGSSTISVSLAGFSMYQFSLIVWAPSTPISLQVSDSQLNAIVDWLDPSKSCAQQYQRTHLSAAVTFTSASSSFAAILSATSPFFQPITRLTSSQPLVCQPVLSNGEVFIQGLTPGDCSISFQVLGRVLGSVAVTVTSDPVSVSRLRVSVIQTFSMSLNSSSVAPLVGVVSPVLSASNLLTQELQFANVEVAAIFPDAGSSPFPVTLLNGLQLTSLNSVVFDIPSGTQSIRARASGSGLLLSATWTVPTCHPRAIGSGLGPVNIQLPGATSVSVSIVTPVLVPIGDVAVNFGSPTTTFFTIILNYPGYQRDMTTDPRFVLEIDALFA